MSTAWLRLSIDVGSDPIEGTVVTDGDRSQHFCGWVELVAAIEAVRAAAAPEDPGVSAEKH